MTDYLTEKNWRERYGEETHSDIEQVEAFIGQAIDGIETVSSINIPTHQVMEISNELRQILDTIAAIKVNGGIE